MLPVPAIKLQPSRRLMRWITVLYGLAAFVCLHLPWPVPARLALVAVVVVDGWCRQRAVRRIWGISALRVSAAHEMQVQMRDCGQWQAVELRAPCHLLPGLAILHVQQGGRARFYVLEPGMMSGEEWRRLRVWMKWRLPEIFAARPGIWVRLRRRLAALRSADGK